MGITIYKIIFCLCFHSANTLQSKMAKFTLFAALFCIIAFNFVFGGDEPEPEQEREKVCKVDDDCNSTASLVYKFVCVEGQCKKLTPYFLNSFCDDKTVHKAIRAKVCNPENFNFAFPGNNKK